ncbi:hypothetical protein PFISCL1PPCAC_19238, partial [Pristionchus fissidentatus]
SYLATLVIPQFFLVAGTLCTLGFTACILRTFPLIHGNCKILLNLINFAQICVVLSHLGKLFALSPDGEFTQDHPWYVFTQLLHEFGYFLCSSTEFMVVVERAVACRLLRKYDQTPTNYPVFLSLSTISCISSFIFSYLVHIRKHKLECTIFAESMDLLTLLLAILCHSYSRKRYQHMLFNSSNLGSRYQLREVAEITRALIPISIVSVGIKLGASTLVWLRIIYKDDLPSYALMNCIYQSLHTLNAFLWCALILYRHRGLRQKAFETLRRITFCNWDWIIDESQYHRNMPEIDFSTNPELTQAHFDLLSASWQNFPKT